MEEFLFDGPYIAKGYNTWKWSRGSNKVLTSKHPKEMSNWQQKLKSVKDEQTYEYYKIIKF